MTAEQGKPLAESKGEIAYAHPSSNGLPKRQAGLRRCHSRPSGRQANSRAAAARGRGRGHHTVEFSGRDDHAQGRTRAGGRLYHGLQAGDPDSLFRAGIGGTQHRAGIPKGVFNVITGSAAAIGGEMTSNPTVRKLTFTGSTEIGKKLMAQCAGTVKKVSLELGGNAPFIVFDDADLDAAVQGPSPASIETPARPVFAPIVCWCRPAFTMSSRSKLAQPWANCASATDWPVSPTKDR
jgi:succinate-semialdehyde dehydrogenase/glutarate-semialdehyde dehydrogenase